MKSAEQSERESNHDHPRQRRRAGEGGRKEQPMRDTIFCNHYRSMYENKTCKAGVLYDAFKGLPFEQRPCFCRKGKSQPGCDKAEFPTAEEIAAEDAEIERLFANTRTA